MSYYRNGIFVYGKWVHFVTACKREYLAKYPDLQIQKISLETHIRDVINIFVRIGSVNKWKSPGKSSVSEKVVDNLKRRTGSVNKGKSPGRPSVSEEVVDDLRRLEQNPQTSLTKLSQESGVPIAT
ncbi:hypothetical protein Zmor_001805 [Zophobas morio]|uniref:DUF4817 domain-containing protein n=1 Tax=Zophobas morio TaxID=2755281 RepID=A0AA38J3E4_9CUCU|nr:hypothetical protein Zmor_001805 [Zophobas morio]